VAVVVLVWGVKDFRILYLMIWMTIPFAIEIDLPGGLSTDFPAETLMWACCFFLPVYLYLNRGQVSFRFIFNPIFILLLVHFFWIVVTSATSQVPLLSIKFTLAKTWYLVCFIVLPLILFKRVEDYKQWGLFLFIPLVLSIIIVLIRIVNMVLHFQRSTTPLYPSIAITLIMPVVLGYCSLLPGGCERKHQVIGPGCFTHLRWLLC
jgi:hypothetical protein